MSYVVPKGAEQSTVSKFVDVPYQPKDLSITPEGHLLITCNPNRLLEYDVKTGEKLREVRLEISWPIHAMKTSDGQYVL